MVVETNPPAAAWEKAYQSWCVLCAPLKPIQYQSMGGIYAYLKHINYLQQLGGHVVGRADHGVRLRAGG